MKVLVIGSGAVGSFYGSLLAKQGAEVSMVARSDYEHIKAYGIEVRSDAGFGCYRFQPAEVVRDAGEIEVKPDYVLLCTKVVEGCDRVGLLRGALGPRTSIVLISNGVEIEGEIAAAYPDNELISGLAFICVTRTGPGQIWHQCYGRLALGKYPGGLSEQVNTLASIYEQAGIACVATEDIMATRWQKCVWNAALSPLSVLSGGLSTANILDTQESFVRAVMEEIREVAAAVGHPLPADTVEKQITSTYKMPPYKTSMLLDFEAGRPMETEAILGNAVRAGQRARVAIPRLESLYALLKLTELRISNPSASRGNPLT